MSAPPVRKRMTTDEFLAWAVEQPEGERYELVAGEVVAMAPERLARAEVKALVWLAVRTAIAAAGLRCEALPDGVSVDRHTAHEPDALVRCGERLPADTVKLSDPVIVVEVLSPSTRARDAGAKLEDYYRLASVRHYLIVKTDSRSVIHHRKDEAGEIATRILRSGRLALDPPGVMAEVQAFFG